MTAKGQRRLTGHWRSRIVGHERVDPRSIKANPLNWREHPEHQQAAMRSVIEKIGVIQGVIVNKRTRNLIDGHLRHQLAIENGEELIDVTFVDMTPQEEKLALAVFNPLADLAATDPDTLAQLLGMVQREEDGALASFLSELDENVGATILKSTEPQGSRTRAIGKTAHVMRLMLEMPDVGTVERAIGATGVMNRGEAMLIICRQYLGNQNAEGQHDTAAQGGIEAQLAAALGDGADRPRNPRRRRARVPAGVPESDAGDRVRDGSLEGGTLVPAATDLERVPRAG